MEGAALFWWGEAPERSNDLSEAIGIYLAKRTARSYAAPSRGPALDHGSARSIGLTHYVNWYARPFVAEALGPFRSLAPPLERPRQSPPIGHSIPAITHTYPTPYWLLDSRSCLRQLVTAV